METPPLVVLDTNVLVAALCRREESPSFRILRYIQQGIVPLTLMQKLHLEYESVLTREGVLRLVGVDEDEIMMVLDALTAIALQSEVFYLWRPNLLDETDNFVIEATIATGAVVVTKNIADFQTGELKFPDLVVLTPQQYCDLYLLASGDPS